VSARLADYKAPDRLILLDALPLTMMGKVDKLALRALAAKPGGESTRPSVDSQQSAGIA
jgi:non-ribosomal peptide synthetase component E (peptide arylation enzyme)